MRIGHGYDAHQLAAGRRLVLGGVVVPYQRDGVDWGLDGHSDADAVAHAVIDALLGAAHLGTIGQHFPSSDERWRGADSLALLEATMQLVRDAGWTLGNVDTTVVAEAPRLGPHLAAMEAALAGAMGAAPGQVSVKAKTTDGMGFEGMGQGISASAVCLLVPA